MREKRREGNERKRKKREIREREEGKEGKQMGFPPTYDASTVKISRTKSQSLSTERKLCVGIGRKRFHRSSKEVWILPNLV